MGCFGTLGVYPVSTAGSRGHGRVQRAIVCRKTPTRAAKRPHPGTIWLAKSPPCGNAQIEQTDSRRIAVNQLHFCRSRSASGLGTVPATHLLPVPKPLPAGRNLKSIGVWRSLVARRVWDPKVGGSNPLTPTADLRNNTLQAIANGHLSVG